MSRVGVLALQGDVREHVQILSSLGSEAVEIKRPEQLESVDALIIPGGESTTIGKMAVRFGLRDPIRRAVERGLPVYGTCAGMILLACAVTEGDQPLIGSLDVVVQRVRPVLLHHGVPRGRDRRHGRQAQPELQ